MPAPKKPEKSIKSEEKERKQREKLVSKLGIQKPGEYTLKIESTKKDIIDGIGTLLRETPDLRLVCRGGSLEQYCFAINLDKDVDLLLKLYDFPQVAKVKLDKSVIRISIN